MRLKENICFYFLQEFLINRDHFLFDARDVQIKVNAAYYIFFCYYIFYFHVGVQYFIHRSMS